MSSAPYCASLLLACLAAATLSSAAAPGPPEPAGAGADGGGTLLEEVGAALGAGRRRSIEKHLPATTRALSPIVAAMQKNEDQKLGHAAARYVLHRLFMQRGWQVRELAPAGGAWGAGSPTGILQGVPGHVRELFEDRLTARGLSLDELAVLAATFKHSADSDMVERLRAAYGFLGLSTGATLQRPQAQQVMDLFMISIIVGRDISSMAVDEHASLVENMPSMFPPWPRSRKFVHDLHRAVVGDAPLTFPSLRRLAVEVGDQLGHWNNAECLARKRELSEIEDRGSGRVRLSEFYRAALYGGKWHFGESADYLRQLGALDDSSPDDPRVIIPNWVNSISNCMSASSSLSVCCLNECDGVLAQFEEELGRPSATPAEVAAVAAAVPSASVPANRTLPAALTHRLGEIADSHGGQVPLHGRLFGQWLHHAYPRECPFPHVSGTIRPMRTEDWERATGSEVQATNEEMLQHIEAARPLRARPGGDAEPAPWTEEEELLEPFPLTAQAPAPDSWSVPGTRTTLTYAALLAASASSAISFAKSSLAAAGAGGCGSKVTVYSI